jgi:DNA (cytosine-5)-methyltransferase 1
MAKDKAFLKEVKALGASLADDEYDLFPLVTNDANDLFAEHEAPVAPKDFLIKSEEHGVPQTRHRVIICGIKKSLVKKRGWPQKLERQGATTLADVISSLPKLRSRITKQTVNDVDWEDVVGSEIKRLVSVGKPELASNTTYEKRVKKARIKRNKQLSEFLEDALGPITEHKTRSHMLSDLARYYFCADYGERENSSPRISQWPTGEIAPQHKDIQHDGNQLTASSFVDRFKVQLWDKPSSTITSHISKDGHHFIHPDKTQCRSLSVREAARIQTFPDSYQFCGGISQQFHQIGNAVPPYLAFQIANILREYLSAS